MAFNPNKNNKPAAGKPAEAKAYQDSREAIDNAHPAEAEAQAMVENSVLKIETALHGNSEMPSTSPSGGAFDWTTHSDIVEGGAHWLRIAKGIHDSPLASPQILNDYERDTLVDYGATVADRTVARYGIDGDLLHAAYPTAGTPEEALEEHLRKKESDLLTNIALQRAIATDPTRGNRVRAAARRQAAKLNGDLLGVTDTLSDLTNPDDPNLTVDEYVDAEDDLLANPTDPAAQTRRDAAKTALDDRAKLLKTETKVFAEIAEEFKPKVAVSPDQQKQIDEAKEAEKKIAEGNLNKLRGEAAEDRGATGISRRVRYGFKRMGSWVGLAEHPSHEKARREQTKNDYDAAVIEFMKLDGADVYNNPHVAQDKKDEKRAQALSDEWDKLSKASREKQLHTWVAGAGRIAVKYQWLIGAVGAVAAPFTAGTSAAAAAGLVAAAQHDVHTRGFRGAEQSGTHSKILAELRRNGGDINGAQAYATELMDDEESRERNKRGLSLFLGGLACGASGVAANLLVSHYFPNGGGGIVSNLSLDQALNGNSANIPVGSTHW